MIKLTTAYHKIAALKQKHRVIQGGAGASKTFSILIRFFLLALRSKGGLEFLIVSDSYVSLKDGAIAVMRKILGSAGYNWNEFYNKQDKDLTIFGCIFQFRYIDRHNPEQFKGIRRDYIFVNEATKTNFTTLDQAIFRVRIAAFYDFNPDVEFWVHTKIIPLDNCDFIQLTHNDNEALPLEERKEILQRIEQSKLPGASDGLKNWVRIYGYGEIGVYSARQIYSYSFIDKIPKDAKRIPSGMDFGISPDPTIKIDIWRKGNNLYIDEVFCENNLMPEKIKGAERMSVVDKLKEVGTKKGRLIIGDSANRTTILDMRKHGYNIKGVKKGKVIDGINDVRGYNLFITRRSVNMKDGFESWYFKMDANEKIIPEPDGHEPDGLAALRYVVRMKRRW